MDENAVREYALWHGSARMDAIRQRFSPGRQLVAADGCWLIDANEHRMLDFRAGISNVSLGYSRSDIVAAMCDQASRVPFACSLRFGRQAPVTHDYANELVRRAPRGLEHVRFTHTGSTAVETAIQVARAAHRNLGDGRRNVVVSFDGSYHGISAYGIAASGQTILHDLYGPLPAGFVTLPQPVPDQCGQCTTGATGSCAIELRRVFDELGQSIASVIVEPVYANTVTALPHHFLDETRRLCDASGALLIFDEVVTGFGRSGVMFESDRIGVVPDLMCVAKAMTAGYAALGAVFATARVFEAFLVDGAPHFALGSSTDGHPISCAAGRQVLHILDEEEVVPRWGRTYERLAALVHDAIAGLPTVTAVRAAGGMIGIDVVDNGGNRASLTTMRRIERACDDAGLLVQYSGSNLVLVPPLVVDSSECEFAVGVLASAIAAAERPVAA